MLMMKVLLCIAIAMQVIATIYAIRLIRITKYNSIWILFIIVFTLLSVERIFQLGILRGADVPDGVFVWAGLIISVCSSIAVLFTHRLIIYIERLNRQRQLFNKRILTAVLRTEEQSRSRFAKELHDGLGPLLSSAKMSLSALPKEGASAEQAEIIRNTSYVIDEAIRSVREISNNMSPQVLLDFGLARGIQNFIQKSVAIHTGIKIRFTTNLKTERFDDNMEVIIYRVACELINNSLKHSGCKEINLSLSYNSHRVQLDYSDNGCGFNPRAMMDCGMGLSNMSSRINSLNGTLDITSSAGKGMRAAVTIDTSTPPVKRSERWKRP